MITKRNDLHDFEVDFLDTLQDFFDDAPTLGKMRHQLKVQARGVLLSQPEELPPPDRIEVLRKWLQNQLVARLADPSAPWSPTGIDRIGSALADLELRPPCSKRDQLAEKLAKTRDVLGEINIVIFNEAIGGLTIGAPDRIGTDDTLALLIRWLATGERARWEVPGLLDRAETLLSQPHPKADEEPEEEWEELEIDTEVMEAPTEAIEVPEGPTRRSRRSLVGVSCFVAASFLALAVGLLSAATSSAPSPTSAATGSELPGPSEDTLRSDEPLFDEQMDPVGAIDASADLESTTLDPVPTGLPGPPSTERERAPTPEPTPFTRPPTSEPTPVTRPPRPGPTPAPPGGSTSGPKGQGRDEAAEDSPSAGGRDQLQFPSGTDVPWFHQPRSRKERPAEPAPIELSDPGLRVPQLLSIKPPPDSAWVEPAVAPGGRRRPCAGSSTTRNCAPADHEVVALRWYWGEVSPWEAWIRIGDSEAAVTAGQPDVQMAGNRVTCRPTFDSITCRGDARAMKRVEVRFGRVE